MLHNHRIKYFWRVHSWALWVELGFSQNYTSCHPHVLRTGAFCSAVHFFPDMPDVYAISTRKFKETQHILCFLFPPIHVNTINNQTALMPKRLWWLDFGLLIVHTHSLPLLRSVEPSSWGQNPATRHHTCFYRSTHTDPCQPCVSLSTPISSLPPRVYSFMNSTNMSSDSTICQESIPGKGLWTKRKTKIYVSQEPTFWWRQMQR